MLPIFHCLGCKERVVLQHVVGFLQECFSRCFVPFFPRLLHQCVEVLQVFHHGKPVLVFSAVLVEFAHLHTDRCEPPNLCPFHMLQHWVVFSSRSQVSELKVLQPLASFHANIITDSHYELVEAVQVGFSCLHFKGRAVQPFDQKTRP